jgi:hypothetical protein
MVPGNGTAPTFVLAYAKKVLERAVGRRRDIWIAGQVDSGVEAAVRAQPRALALANIVRQRVHAHPDASLTRIILRVEIGVGPAPLGRPVGDVMVQQVTAPAAHVGVLRRVECGIEKLAGLDGRTGIGEVDELPQSAGTDPLLLVRHDCGQCP